MKQKYLNKIEKNKTVNATQSQNNEYSRVQNKRTGGNKRTGVVFSPKQ